MYEAWVLNVPSSSTLQWSARPVRRRTLRMSFPFMEMLPSMDKAEGEKVPPPSWEAVSDVPGTEAAATLAFGAQ